MISGGLGKEISIFTWSIEEKMNIPFTSKKPADEKPAHDSRAIANIFVEKFQQDNKQLTITQLVKLVYFAHGWTLGYTGEPLISDPVEAWRYGPVVPLVYKTFRPQGVIIYKKAAPENGDEPYAVDGELTGSERNIIDGVYRNYSNLPINKLSALTHIWGAPWHRYYNSKEIQVIENEAIREYYKARVEELEIEEQRRRS